MAFVVTLFVIAAALYVVVLIHKHRQKQMADQTIKEHPNGAVTVRRPFKGRIETTTDASPPVTFSDPDPIQTAIRESKLSGEPVERLKQAPAARFKGSAGQKKTKR